MREQLVAEHTSFVLQGFGRKQLELFGGCEDSTGGSSSRMRRETSVDGQKGDKTDRERSVFFLGPTVISKLRSLGSAAIILSMHKFWDTSENL